MRTLSSALTSAQVALNKPPIWKVVLSRTSQTTRGYGTARVRKISHIETPDSATAEITLNNSDAALTTLDFEHYQAVISYGYNTRASRTAWAANTAYSLDDIRVPVTANGYQYRCSVAGTSHATTEPTWPTDLGVTVTDGTVTWEMDGNSGEEYSYSAPLRVRVQEFHSGRGILKLILRAEGIQNQMAQDKAIAEYTQTSSDTNTVKTLITAIATAGAGLSGAFNGYTAITVVYDSEDSLIDVFIPAEFFRIRINDDRWSKIKELLAYTKCKARIQNDGKLHIFVPTISGVSYNYEYKFNVSGDHPFFNKTTRLRFVDPNKEIVSTASGISPAYTGNATSATSYALDPKIHTTIGRYVSNAQCTAIAEALIEQNELNAEKGFATVPMNVGQELWDYVKVTDSRANDTRIGNIQYLGRIVDVGKGASSFLMQLSFGKVSTQSLISNMLTAGGEGNDTRLSNEQILSLYENIVNYLEDQAQQTTWLQEVGVPENLDAIADGTDYKRLLSTQISAGVINLTDTAVYAAGYNPSEKRRVFGAEPTTPYDLRDLWTDGVVVKRCTTARASGAYVAGDWTQLTQDEMADGATWGRTRLTSLSAGHIKLTSDTAAAGKWYQKSGVILDADYGIALYGGQIALKTFPTLADALAGTNLQCSVDTIGRITAAGGSVVLDALGVAIYGVDKGFITASLTATVSAFDNAGGGLVGVTTAAVHGLATNDYVFIRGSTNYNGYFQITVTSTTRFTITDTWVADDATGKVLTLQTYVDTNGKIYAGAGAVKIDVGGIELTGSPGSGQYLTFKSGANAGYIYQSSTQLILNADTLTLYPSGTDKLIRPPNDNDTALGSASFRFKEVHSNVYVGNLITTGSYAGDDTTDRAIPHNLGRVPKLIFVFITAAPGKIWDILIAPLTASGYWELNTSTEGNYALNTTPDDTNFYVNGGTTPHGLNSQTFGYTYRWIAM